MRVAGRIDGERIRLRPLGPHPLQERVLRAGLDRLIVARQSMDDLGVVLSWDSDNQYQFFPVLDRAHFPVLPEPLTPALPELVQPFATATPPGHKTIPLILESA